VLALITWLVRRIIGARSKNHYLGYVFGSLWFIGLASAITLSGLFARNFKTKSGVEDAINITQPTTGKLTVNVARNNVRYYNDDWFGIEWDEDMPFYGTNADTLMMNTIRVNVVKSKDSSYHIYRVRFSRGNTPEVAKNLAERIQFNVNQQDSVLTLPKGFGVSKNEKFRNQQVLVVVEVPVGKRIEMHHSVNDYNWFSVNFNRRRGFNIEGDDETWDYTYSWSTNTEYVMTPEGLERTRDRRNSEPADRRGRTRSGESDPAIRVEDKTEDTRYRYRRSDEPAQTIDTVRKVTSELMVPFAISPTLL
jgi:hypothetical protein